MKAWLFRLQIALLVCMASAGPLLENEVLAKYAPWLAAGALLLIASRGVRKTYGRAHPNRLAAASAGAAEPLPLALDWTWYVRAFISWLDAFKRTYLVTPGLYFTGDRYCRDDPLLVTANCQLTVFLLLRNLRAIRVRLLVVDTDGINVWCAGSKGRFSNAAILTELERYPRELLTTHRFLDLILPKLGLAGVDIRALRQEHIKPIIGPILAKDLPAYLESPPYRDCDDQRVLFGLQSRLFTWLPGLMQYVAYNLWLVVALIGIEAIWGIAAPLWVLPLTAALATAYPVFFPRLPGRRFAIKGLWLASAACLALLVSALFSPALRPPLPAAAAFIFATSLFIGLSYTGNSAVSNYTRVRAEIARFLPLNVLLYVASFILYLAGGVAQ
ncbi:MAG: hypothetical protein HYV63_27735 [Candidatus Schekmanbacteria bacterium]|nr:hypothetical protein [Candidatus Schekmanbacteria bacterium]